MSAHYLDPETAPFFLPGGPTGCLLIHGLTGTPFEMRGLGQRLHQAGYTVLAPRLAHHATRPADLNRSRWPDWYFSALDGWHLLQGCCERVVVMGLSMGGATALLLAAQELVAGVVAMSAPALSPDPRLRWARPLSRVLPYYAKPESETAAPLTISYPVWPVRAMAELRTYLQVVEAALPQVTAPALLFHARHDATVPPENLAHIYGRLGSRQKEMVWVERGDHIVIEDVDREGVLERVLGFLQACTQAPGVT